MTLLLKLKTRSSRMSSLRYQHKWYVLKSQGTS
jgi:hypothetical protein